MRKSPLYHSIMTLDQHDIERLLRMEDLIPAMADALATLSAGRAVQPVRVVVPVAEHRGFFGVMPAYAGGALGAKLVTWYPEQSGRADAPRDRAVVPSRNGRAAGDDGWNADHGDADGRGVRGGDRPAGQAGRRRAGDPRIRRAGAEPSRGAAPRPIVPRRARLESTECVRVRSAARRASRLSAEDAVRGADVIVVATMSRVPVLSGAWLSPGAHINAVGAVRPDWRELDDEAVTRARVFVESREAASRESGDVIAARGIAAEIGEVIAGTARGRESADEITLFKSVGVAVEDVATASLVYRLATAGTGPRPD